MNRTMLAIGLTVCCALAPSFAATAVGKSAAASNVDVTEQRSGDALAERFLNWDAPVLAALSESANPRDRALAATSYFDGKIGEAKLADAAVAAPGDALVQWLAVVQLDPASAAARDAAARLTRIEPDNGAAWTMLYMHGERDAESALRRAAASTRFDDHWMDLVHAWLAVYSRDPSVAPTAPLTPPWSNEYGAAFTHAAATAGPAWSVLIERCSEGSAGAAERRLLCAELGRLMSRHGTSLGSRMIGFGVMRVANAGVVDAQDQAAQRQLYWYVTSQGRYFADHPDLDAGIMAAIERDAATASDEVAFIRGVLRRVGMPLQPPHDWSSPMMQALRADAVRSGAADTPSETAMSAGERALKDPRRTAVRAALAASADPRDRVLAAAVAYEADPVALRRDAQLASDDPLVQWLAASHLGASGHTFGAREAAARLTRLEPDNGAAWMLAFALAGEQGDADAAALGQSAADATRFDDHSMDITRSWLDAWDRLAPEAAPAQDPDSNYAAAFLSANLTSTPGTVYQSRTCLRDRPVTGDLRTACARLGSLMLHHGRSATSRFIGADILKALDRTGTSTDPAGALSDQDRATVRRIQWYQSAVRADIPQRQRVANLRAYPDWVSIARHRLELAGLPFEPPAHWKRAHANSAPH